MSTTDDRTLDLVVVSAGTSDPSSTRMLAGLSTAELRQLEELCVKLAQEPPAVLEKDFAERGRHERDI